MSFPFDVVMQASSLLRMFESLPCILDKDSRSIRGTIALHPPPALHQHWIHRACKSPKKFGCRHVPEQQPSLMLVNNCGGCGTITIPVILTLPPSTLHYPCDNCKAGSDPYRRLEKSARCLTAKTLHFTSIRVVSIHGSNNSSCYKETTKIELLSFTLRAFHSTSVS